MRSSREWEEEIEQNTYRKFMSGRGASSGAGSSGLGETVAGGVLGGLLLGPFGAMFGASLGNSLGAKNALNRARQEEMERMGITQDMLDAAQETGIALERSMEGLAATQQSYDTQLQWAKSLERDAEKLYQQAQDALSVNQEDKARTFLLERTRILDKLKNVLKFCAEEKRRLATMEDNVKTIERRAMEIDSLLRRTVGAKARQDTPAGLESMDELGLSLSKEDPLLKKFRDMGID